MAGYLEDVKDEEVGPSQTDHDSNIDNNDIKNFFMVYELSSTQSTLWWRNMQVIHIQHASFAWWCKRTAQLFILIEL